MTEFDVLKLGELYVLKIRNYKCDDWKTIFITTDVYEFEKEFTRLTKLKNDNSNNSTRED